MASAMRACIRHGGCRHKHTLSLSYVYGIERARIWLRQRHRRQRITPCDCPALPTDQPAQGDSNWGRQAALFEAARK